MNLEETLQPNDAASHVTTILLSQIQPDLENTRKIYLSFENPRQLDQGSPDYPKAAAQLEEAERLAASIASEGLINPIDVFRVGTGYKLITGHMRTIAHVLNDADSIEARVRTRKPRNVALLQYIENFNRSDLPFSSRYHALSRAVAEEFDVRDISELADREADVVEVLASKAGIKKTQAYAWRKALLASSDVREAVESGIVTTLAETTDLIAMTVEERQSVYGAFGNAGKEGDAPGSGDPSSPDQGAASASTRHRRARPVRSVRAKPIKDPHVAAEAIKRISNGKVDVSKIDLNDFNQLSVALNHAFMALQSELAKGETRRKSRP
ncbi:ParB/RepB/Spo0J family partition protein [Luteimonas sp. MHLX1A]|uniref:ParB/RepB/Spo0J family partition protein n=1 Tax=Alterluteimonas muca TaxID=2878684 RepID=UPI001E5842C5|nr:ParB N-terminal domain-containing protein [Luteimonas sp. MHLX1A]MCD9046746.1 ParB N-terminal domain-containing protein [Luteimonas sp. MHLX1A]